ncbi:helix-turn-helix domain-containing protein [Candidatus Omnitrophota bacterium]
MDNLLTPKQLSELLQVKLSTVYKWVHYGYVPHIKIGSLIRFKADRVETWVKKREKKGRSACALKEVF